MIPTGKVYFYVRPSWRGKGIHTPLLNPWWGNPISESSLLTKNMYDTYSFDTSLYAITDDLKAAHMVLAPYPHVWFLRHDRAFFEECVAIAREANLPLLVDGTGDFDHPINAPNVFMLRYSGYRFLPERGRIEVPPLADDLLERYKGGQLEVRKKGAAKPVVGFAGWADLSPKQYLRAVLKQLPVRLRALIDERYRTCIKGIFWRRKAIQVLQRSPLVELNLRTRATFSGSTKTAKGDLITLQREMVDTILESDYALEVRGDPNTSTRLFEILSLGRIPVIIDTERIFPFSDKIDYSSFALIVDFRDINKLPEKIAEFHKTVSPERFEEMQRNAREAYVKYFRIDALMRHILEAVRTTPPS